VEILLTSLDKEQRMNSHRQDSIIVLAVSVFVLSGIASVVRGQAEGVVDFKQVARQISVEISKLAPLIDKLDKIVTTMKEKGLTKAQLEEQIKQDADVAFGRVFLSIDGLLLREGDVKVEIEKLLADIGAMLKLPEHLEGGPVAVRLKARQKHIAEKRDKYTIAFGELEKMRRDLEKDAVWIVDLTYFDTVMSLYGAHTEGMKRLAAEMKRVRGDFDTKVQAWDALTKEIETEEKIPGPRPFFSK
jgi:hypothetical protein